MPSDHFYRLSGCFTYNHILYICRWIIVTRRDVCPKSSDVSWIPRIEVQIVEMITLPETNSSPLKIEPSKRKFLLETSIFRGYVSFRECNPYLPFTSTTGRDVRSMKVEMTFWSLNISVGKIGMPTMNHFQNWIPTLETSWHVFSRHVKFGLNDAPLKINDWNHKITQLKRKIIWTKPPFF